MLELLPALHVAGLVLRSARDQLPALQAHRERCTLLVSRCERLLDEVSAQCKEDHSPLIQRQLFSLESVCATIRDTIVDLAAEGKLTDAFFMFNVGTRISIGEIQAEIAEASRIDQLHFITYLENISQTDQQIIDALRNQNLRLEETLMAFMKHQQTRKAKSGNEPLSEQFIHRAVSALQRIGTSSSVEILPWQITSLEVEYERTEANLLGSGGFGKVFKGQWNGDIIALKEMHKSVFGETRNERHLKAFEKEIKIWSRLHHPRILPFYGACLASEKPFLVTKYCANGNVMDYMRDFPEVNRLLILHEISSGMVYLHEKTIIHADLKAANILIGDDHKALICDFGLSHLKDQTMSTSTMHTIQGTLNYMAPEYLDGAPIDYPADIYSFAMTAWQIYTGLVPFSDVPQRAFYRVVIDREERPEYPNSMSSPLWVLVQECWDQDPKSRPTFLEVEASLLPMVEPCMLFWHLDY
ncbi:kinase-like domain-containing protein [Crepidotus variabilis]|uniref:Kinase-like domain-containing protein n=1 Tax=Crepidotus variabilis TaxID=179855 RepID=A0A9P6EHA8_9AGAR|nr:kinase-like domain-containing protein [Crepidotus variabilis]